MLPAAMRRQRRAGCVSGGGGRKARPWLRPAARRGEDSERSGAAPRRSQRAIQRAGRRALAMAAGRGVAPGARTGEWEGEGEDAAADGGEGDAAQVVLRRGRGPRFESGGRGFCDLGCLQDTRMDSRESASSRQNRWQELHPVQLVIIDWYKLTLLASSREFLNAEDSRVSSAAA